MSDDVCPTCCQPPRERRREASSGFRFNGHPAWRWRCWGRGHLWRAHPASLVLTAQHGWVELWSDCERCGATDVRRVLPRGVPA